MHELPNNGIRLRTLKKLEISRKSLNWVDLTTSAQPVTWKLNLDKCGRKLRKISCKALHRTHILLNVVNMSTIFIQDYLRKQIFISNSAHNPCNLHICVVLVFWKNLLPLKLIFRQISQFNVLQKVLFPTLVQSKNLELKVVEIGEGHYFWVITFFLLKCDQQKKNVWVASRVAEQLKT